MNRQYRRSGKVAKERRERWDTGVERWRRTAVATAVEAHEHHFY